jgi:xanthosine utilization system XapX-like protein
MIRRRPAESLAIAFGTGLLVGIVVGLVAGSRD